MPREKVPKNLTREGKLKLKKQKTAQVIYGRPLKAIFGTIDYGHRLNLWWQNYLVHALRT